MRRKERSEESLLGGAKTGKWRLVFLKAASVSAFAWKMSRSLRLKLYLLAKHAKTGIYLEMKGIGRMKKTKTVGSSLHLPPKLCQHPFPLFCERDGKIFSFIARAFFKLYQSADSILEGGV